MTCPTRKGSSLPSHELSAEKRSGCADMRPVTGAVLAGNEQWCVERLRSATERRPGVAHAVSGILGALTMTTVLLLLGRGSSAAISGLTFAAAWLVLSPLVLALQRRRRNRVARNTYFGREQGPWPPE